MRAVHDQRAAITFKLFTPATAPDPAIPVVNGDGMNFLPGNRGNIMRRDAGIDEALVVAVKVDVVEDRGLIVNPRYFARRHAMTPW